jgi:hypothetical protein
MPQEFPWSFEPGPEVNRPTLPAGTRFVGIRTAQGTTSLLYDIVTSDDRTVRVQEQPRAMIMGATTAIERRFELSPCDRELWFLAHAEMGKAG